MSFVAKKVNFVSDFPQDRDFLLKKLHSDEKYAIVLTDSHARGGILMAFMPVTGIVYKSNQRKSEKLEFVHEITRRRQKPCFEYPHKQDFYEIIIFNSGTSDIMVGERVYNCGAGDILILTPEEEHCGRSHEGLLDRYVLHFGREAFSVFGEQGRHLLRIFTDHAPYTDNLLRLSPDAAKQMNILLADTDRVLKLQGDAGAMMDAGANIMKFLILLRRSMNITKEQGTPSRVMLQILAYMETNYSEIDNMEEICREFGVSRSNMWRMFREYLHQSPGEYLRNLRLQYGRYALERGENVTQVCMMCGFTDCSHFIRLFRDKYGTTPYRYQAEHINQRREDDSI